MEPQGSSIAPSANESHSIRLAETEQRAILSHAQLDAYARKLPRKSQAAIEYILDKWPNSRPPINLTRLKFELKQNGGVEDITDETLSKHLDAIYGERGYFGS